VKKKTNDDQLSLAGTEEGEILARLNERVEKAVSLIQDLRKERDSLKKRLDEAEAKLGEQTGASEQLATLQEEHDKFRRERTEIRDRIESILGNLESLDEAAAE
jgi:FtsZ-binding cell division protein ZapB